MKIPPQLSGYGFEWARPADAGRVARLFARLNGAAETRCLHAGGGSVDPAELRRGLTAPGTTFLLVEWEADHEVLGAVALREPTETLWGPSVSPTVVDPVGISRVLMGRLGMVAPGFPHRLDAFPDEANATLRQTLRELDFREGQRTHVFVAPRPTVPVAGPFGEELRERHVAAFARMHGEMFPTNADEGTDAGALLAGRGAERRIFVVPDASGLRLLGYVCALVGDSPREGFIEYLAVREDSRGRGVGGQLLRTALRWCFEDLALPQAALCVSEWRVGRHGARRLYEREGFARRFTGVGMRWRDGKVPG